jgi:hypothetical protein
VSSRVPCIESRRERAQLRDPADKGIALGRKVVANLADRTPEFALEDHAVGFVDVCRWRERRNVAHAKLEHFDRRLDSFETVVAVTLDLRVFRERAGKRLPRGGAHERLPAGRETHDPGRQRCGKAIDFRRPCALGDVLGRILAQRDLAGVEADSRGDVEVRERRVIRERVAGGVGHIVEQQEQAVGAPDLAAVMAGEQVARPAIVCGPDFGGAHVAEPLAESGAVHHVGEEKGALGHLMRMRIPSALLRRPAPSARA